MSPKHHPTPLSGGDRKALSKELNKSYGMEAMLAAQSAQLRGRAEPMLRQADDLLCQAWNERMWRDGEPIDPSPTIDQAINGGFTRLQVRCSRCRTPREVDLAALTHVSTTCIHDLASRLRCESCKKAGYKPLATLLQLCRAPSGGTMFGPKSA